MNFLFIDLDNTILNFNAAERVALTKALTDLGVEPTEEILDRYNKINMAQWKLLEKGIITRPEVKSRRYRLLFDEFNIQKDPDETARIYEGYLAHGHFFMDGAPELLESVYGKCKLYLATNGTACVQHGRLNSADIEKYFDNIFISEELGYDKPSREYFTACFNKIPNFDKSKAYIIGDSLTSDIQGGINAEIKTVWFNPNNEKNETEIKPDFEIHTLKEIEKFI